MTRFKVRKVIDKNQATKYVVSGGNVGSHYLPSHTYLSKEAAIRDKNSRNGWLKEYQRTRKLKAKANKPKKG